MFGNIINNRQLAHLVEVDKAIAFHPFDRSKLKLAHYPLHAAGILWPGPINVKGVREYTFRCDFATKDDYTFEAGEYAIAEIEEWIVLPEGIVGHFLPSSSLVERGFGLTAGKLDPQYGSLGGVNQKIRFGLKNLLNEKNVYAAGSVLAHVYFVDLRGLYNVPAQFSEPEMEEFLKRYARFKRAFDDGPPYE